MSFIVAFVLKSILSEYCYLCFLLICLHKIYFFHPLIFTMCVSLTLKWVSWGQLIEGSCFFIQSTYPVSLIRVASPPTFKVIVDIYVLIAILLIVFFCSMLGFHSCVIYFLYLLEVFDVWLPWGSHMFTHNYSYLLHIDSHLSSKTS